MNSSQQNNEKKSEGDSSPIHLVGIASLACFIAGLAAALAWEFSDEWRMENACPILCTERDEMRSARRHEIERNLHFKVSEASPSFTEVKN